MIDSLLAVLLFQEIERVSVSGGLSKGLAHFVVQVIQVFLSYDAAGLQYDFIIYLVCFCRL